MDLLLGISNTKVKSLFFDAWESITMFLLKKNTIFKEEATAVLDGRRKSGEQPSEQGENQHQT